MLIIEEKFDDQFNEQDELNQSKVTYCEALFEKSTNTNTIKCKNLYLTNFYNQLYFKYPKKLSYNDFFSECMYYTFLAIMDFEILDGGNWSEIIDGTDKINIGRLMIYIKNTVQKKIYQYVVNGDKLFTRGEIEGQKGQHVMVKLNLISLDTLINDNGEAITLERLVSNEQNFFNVFDGYCWNHYIQWFMANKEKILTKNQLNYLESDTNCTRKNKRIRERVLRFWEQENPLGKKTLREIHKEKELKIWNSLLYLVYDDSIDCSDLNQIITNWIVQNMNDQFVSNLVYDSLTGSECQTIVRAFQNPMQNVPNVILYRLVWAVEERVQKLVTSVSEGVRFYKRKDECGRWSLEEHNRYAKYLKQFKSCKCYVYYNSNFKKVQTFRNKSKQNILEVTPNGIEILTQVN